MKEFEYFIMQLIYDSLEQKFFEDYDNLFLLKSNNIITISDSISDDEYEISIRKKQK